MEPNIDQVVVRFIYGSSLKKNQFRYENNLIRVCNYCPDFIRYGQPLFITYCLFALCINIITVPRINANTPNRTAIIINCIRSFGETLEGKNISIIAITIVATRNIAKEKETAATVLLLRLVMPSLYCHFLKPIFKIFSFQNL